MGCGERVRPCPCEAWRLVPAHYETAPMPTLDADGNLGVSWENVWRPDSWVCERRYPLLPEGGCGYLGREPATRDAPRGR